MGLKGLFTLLKDYHSIWFDLEKIQNRPVKLIIDGRTIANAIYSECRFDGLCGGQYTEFFEKVFRLFLNLRDFGFEILILMECSKHESHDVDVFDRRMARWIQFKKSLRDCEAYNRLPVLGYHVFLKVANILNIEIIPTDLDTSTTLVGIAKLLNAYVLTNRNDAYICDIPGVLALSYINWESDYLEGHFYSFNSFLEFTNLETNYIPLLFLLSSPETYITDPHCVQEVNEAFSNITSHSIPEGERIYFKRKFERALNYFKRKAHESYLSSYSLIKSKIDNRFHLMIDESLELVKTRIFDPQKLSKLDTQKPYFGMDYSSTLLGEDGLTFELLFSLDYVYWGALGLNEQCVFISSRAENFTLDAAGLISQHIRSIIYGIICPQKEYIKEHSRSKEPLSHKIDKVAPLTVYNGRKTPFHLLLPEMKEEDKIEFLFHSLNFDSSTLSELPEYWYLPVVSVHYWLSQCTANVPEEIGKLLLLCFLACSNGEDHHVELLPLDTTRTVIYQRIDTAHYISEWEYVVSDIIALKSLLRIERLILAPERLYNGLFFFSLLISQKFTDKVKNYLLENDKIVRIYELMSSLALSPIYNRKPNL
ncbi:Protein asteroid-like protein 1-like [Oopsacas minuta]|uniref:Protein asteroid-like protein 1-like n=1 Tax=Oopsacas minuta TaxID=111878 RepID=A0AAV7K2K3_9METZ|nr:Protein asteroid-like protein 1-like [Oopsacas minuta]